MIVMLAVNNPDNGVHTGRVRGVHFDVPGHFDISLELEDGDMVCRLVANSRLRIGLRTFPIETYSRWVGNWCWDAVHVTPETAQEIAQFLRSTGKWNCVAGYVELFDAWESGAPLRFSEHL